MFKKKTMEVVAMENETMVETPVVEEAVKVKTKMSLKKKLMIGGGVVLGLGIGALALMLKKGKPEGEEVEGFDDVEENELIAMENAESETMGDSVTEF